MKEDAFHKRWTNLFVVATLIVIAGLLFYTLRYFIDGFLGAVMFYVLFRPLMTRLIARYHFRKGIAAVIVLLLSLVIVLIPIIVVTYLIIPKLRIIFGDTSYPLQILLRADQRFFDMSGIRFLSVENVKKYQEFAASYVAGLLGESMNMIADIAFMFFIYYFLLVNVGQVEKFLQKNLPVSNERIGQFAKELEDQTISNALGAPLLALIQALFAILGYWIADLPDPVFWGLMTGFFSFFPVIGSAIVVIPASIYQLSTGHTWQGIFIILYGILVIGTMDNVFRFVFQKKFADVHPLVTVIGVICGIQLFGIAGIIFGPLLVSYFLILLQILKEEYPFS